MKNSFWSCGMFCQFYYICGFYCIELVVNQLRNTAKERAIQIKVQSRYYYCYQHLYGFLSYSDYDIPTQPPKSHATSPKYCAEESNMPHCYIIKWWCAKYCIQKYLAINWYPKRLMKLSPFHTPKVNILNTIVLLCANFGCGKIWN